MKAHLKCLAVTMFWNRDQLLTRQLCTVVLINREREVIIFEILHSQAILPKKVTLEVLEPELEAKAKTTALSFFKESQRWCKEPEPKLPGYPFSRGS